MSKKTHMADDNGRRICGASFGALAKNFPPTCIACRNGGKAPSGTGRHRANGEADWTRKCGVCGNIPILPETGMCGPCTFGDASTVNGEW
jgi:hypothetical protein